MHIYIGEGTCWRRLERRPKSWASGGGGGWGAGGAFPCSAILLFDLFYFFVFVFSGILFGRSSPVMLTERKDSRVFSRSPRLLPFCMNLYEHSLTGGISISPNELALFFYFNWGIN